MSTLFELTNEQQEVLNLVANGELTDEQVADTLEALTMEINDKIESYCHVNRLLNSDLEQIKAEESRLKAIRQEKENQIKRLKANLKAAMLNAELTKFDVGLFKGHIRNGVQSVNIIDENLLTDNFVRVVKTADKALIKTALKAGESVPGAELITGESSLIIK